MSSCRATNAKAVALLGNIPEVMAADLINMRRVVSYDPGAPGGDRAVSVLVALSGAGSMRVVG